MIGSDVELVPTLQKKRPVVRVLLDLLLARLEAEIGRALDLSEIRHFRPSDVLEKSTEKPLSREIRSQEGYFFLERRGIRRKGFGIGDKKEDLSKNRNGNMEEGRGSRGKADCQLDCFARRSKII